MYSLKSIGDAPEKRLSIIMQEHRLNDTTCPPKTDWNSSQKNKDITENIPIDCTAKLHLLAIFQKKGFSAL